MTHDDKTAGEAIAAYEIMELVDALEQRMAWLAGHKGYSGNRKLVALRHLMLVEAQLHAARVRLVEAANIRMKEVTE